MRRFSYYVTAAVFLVISVLSGFRVGRAYETCMRVRLIPNDLELQRRIFETTPPSENAGKYLWVSIHGNIHEAGIIDRNLVERSVFQILFGTATLHSHQMRCQDVKNWIERRDLAAKEKAAAEKFPKETR